VQRYKKRKLKVENVIFAATKIEYNSIYDHNRAIERVAGARGCVEEVSLTSTARKLK